MRGTRRSAPSLALAALTGAFVALSTLSPPPVSAQETHVVAVVGLGGTPEFRDRFLGWALDLRAAAVERFGVAPDNALVLAEDPAADPAVHGRSTREAFTETLQGLAGRLTPVDRVLLVLFGHGTFRDGEARLNLPGPDMSAEELAGLLDELPARQVAVVNTASASGPYVEALSAPGRAVITATSTGRERNETRFGGYFVEAFAADGADLDRDGTVSLLEAFTYARTETARSYESENLLLTEHARLDDDGDGEGSDEPVADGGGGVEMLDGAFAAGFILGASGRRGVVASGAAGAERTPPADSALARLYEVRDSLERQVAELRARRSSMDPDDYDNRLEALLLELARTSREIRDREGGGR